MNILQVSTRSPRQRLDHPNRVTLDFLVRGMESVFKVSLGEVNPVQAEIVQENIGDRRFVLRRGKETTF